MRFHPEMVTTCAEGLYEKEIFVCIVLYCMCCTFGCRDRASSREITSEQTQGSPESERDSEPMQGNLESTGSVHESQTDISNAASIEPETTQLKVAEYELDIVPDGAERIVLEEAIRQQSDSFSSKEVKYVYTDDLYNICIRHYDTEQGRKRELTCNGKTMQMTGTGSYDGAYSLCLEDVNKDGYKDIVAYNTSVGQCFINTLLYDGNTYTDIGDIPAGGVEVSAKVLNENKIKVSCKRPEFNGIFTMADLYVRWLEAWGVYANGQLVNPSYEMNGTMEKVGYHFIKKDKDVIIALEMHYTDSGKSTGIVAISYYKAGTAGYEMEDVKFINSNLMSR